MHLEDYIKHCVNSNCNKCAYGDDVNKKTKCLSTNLKLAYKQLCKLNEIVEQLSDSIDDMESRYSEEYTEAYNKGREDLLLSLTEKLNNIGIIVGGDTIIYPRRDVENIIAELWEE